MNQIGIFIRLNESHVALIDKEDHALVDLKWQACCRPLKDGRVRVYAVRELSRGKKQYLHRFIAGNPNTDVDHKDGDTLNCRRNNLRTASRSQNMMNMKKRVNTSSRFKGVSVDRRNGHWLAGICLAGVNKHLGSFKEETDAAQAYNLAAAMHFGDYARLNQC